MALTGLLVASPILAAKADDCYTSCAGDSYSNRCYTNCYGTDGRSHSRTLCFSDGDCYTDTYNDYADNRSHTTTSCFSNGDCDSDTYVEDDEEINKGAPPLQHP